MNRLHKTHLVITIALLALCLWLCYMNRKQFKIMESMLIVMELDYQSDKARKGCGDDTGADVRTFEARGR